MINHQQNGNSLWGNPRRPARLNIPEFFPAGSSSTMLKPDFRISKASIRSIVSRNWMDPPGAGGEQESTRWPVTENESRLAAYGLLRPALEAGAGSKRSQFGVERGGHLRCPNRAPERPSRGPETSPLGGNLKHFIFYCL